MRLWLPPTFQPLPDMPQRVVIECDQQILASNHGFVLQKFDKGTHKFHQSILDAADFQILYCTSIRSTDMTFVDILMFLV